MAYCTQTDIEGAVGGQAALIWITDLSNTAVDTAAVTAAIEWATSKIEQYATGTPGTTGVAGALWTTTPTSAKQAAIDIAVRTLYLRIRREVPTGIEEDYKTTLKLLEKLAEGKVSWVASEPPAAQNAATVYYFGPGSTARTDNPRRTRRDQLDSF